MKRTMPEDLGILRLPALQCLGQIIDDRLTHSTMREIVMRLAGILQINLTIECQKQWLRGSLS